MKLFLGVIEPDKKLKFEDQVIDSLSKIRLWLIQNHLSVNQIVSINLFINSDSMEEYFARKNKINEVINNYFNNSLPVAYLSQSPAGGLELIIEIHAIPQCEYFNIQHKSIGNTNYIVGYDKNQSKFIFASGIDDKDTVDDIFNNAENVFQKVENILQDEGMDFSNIVRQWNYIENIVTEFPTNKGTKQPYQIFNDVRSKYYKKYNFHSGFPAATGIGTTAGGAIISFYAVSRDKGNKILPIDNPLQVSAYNYSENVLVGEAMHKNIGKTSPKFVRAKYIGNSVGEIIFVSGTASIRGEETVALGDLKSQTLITLENIELLITKENLAISGLNTNGVYPSVIFLRAYIKNISDEHIVRDICNEKYPGVPLVLVQSDICRKNLLVEIEGVVGFKNVNAPKY